MSIREYAKSVNFNIVGKLTRVPNKMGGKCKDMFVWLDDAGNEYSKHKKLGTCCIITIDDAVI